MSSFVYIVTNDPKEKCELVSSVFAQALTALSMDFDCDLFVMDNGINLVKKGYIDGLKSEAYESLSVMLSSYKEMGGRIFVCHPSADARHLEEKDCIDGIDGFVNASKLVGLSHEAKAVYTF